MDFLFALPRDIFNWAIFLTVLFVSVAGAAEYRMTRLQPGETVSHGDAVFQGKFVMEEYRNESGTFPAPDNELWGEMGHPMAKEIAGQGKLLRNHGNRELFLLVDTNPDKDRCMERVAVTMEGWFFEVSTDCFPSDK